MAVSESEIEFVLDLFADLGALSHRKMMGGLTIYHAGQVFAILASSGQIYLKAKDAFARELEAEGSVIFSMADDRSMGYWTLPPDCLDDPELACEWARRALAALNI